MRFCNPLVRLTTLNDVFQRQLSIMKMPNCNIGSEMMWVSDFGIKNYGRPLMSKKF